MERNLVIAGTLAAALHAGVLFGFPRGPVPKPREDVPVIKPEPFLWPKDIEPLELIVTSEARGEKRNIEPPPPISEDILVNDPRPFVTEITKMSHVPAIGVAKIPTGPFEPLGEIGPGDGNGPLASIHLDNPPRTRVQGRPVYPREARAISLTGEVLVEFTVDEAGRVLAPRVVRSSDRVFEDATLRAVSKWRFEPGRRHGQIVRFRMAVPVVFRLDE